MKNYFRIMLGRQSVYAGEAYKGDFIGTGWLEEVDLTKKLPDDYRSFNRVMIPVYQREHPGGPKVTAGLACGMLWTVAKFLKIGDIVLCPDGRGKYLVGKITSEYFFKKGAHLPHRRSVKWFQKTIVRSQMSKSLQHSTGSIGTVSDVTRYAEEIEELISGSRSSVSFDANEITADRSLLEKHLESYLVHHWKKTPLSRTHNIVGQQYKTDTGAIDILAISKNKKQLLVIELKRDRANDEVVGQVQRYMGFIKEEILEKGQSVRGMIIAFEDDVGVRRALAVAQGIDFLTYELSFKLHKT